MFKIGLGIEYQGSHFQGWQKQANTQNTLQAMIELALSRIACHQVDIFCAGRTDAGVHAREQVIHFETTKLRPLKAWVAGCNTLLPSAIRVHWAQEVNQQFHARFSAISRTYRYLIHVGETPMSLLSPFVTWSKRNLNETLIQQILPLFLGERDFSSFRSGECQAKTPLRNIHHFQLIKRSSVFIFEITANAFLHHMIRKIMGAVYEVAVGRKEVNWLQDLIAARDHQLNPHMLPAKGLHLYSVQYPEQFSLPKLGYAWLLD